MLTASRQIQSALLKGSPTSVKKSFTKGAKAMGTLHDDITPEEAADIIVAKLKEKFII